MSSQKEFGQDYLARVRYRNDLPPPPGAPKLLDIPHDGLRRFLRPGYASRLLREQPLNIDVDAEGGMPIDMVGVPGYFFGDESAIMAPEIPPPVDPKDAMLLRPLASLGKPATSSTNVSFLRRTEYIGTQKGDPMAAARNAAFKKPKSEAPKRAEINKEDPVYIKKYITKGFDVAYPESRHDGPDTADRVKGIKPTLDEFQAWKKPVHPTNPNLKPVDFYPVMPDLEGFTDAIGYIAVQFKKPPTAVAGTLDERLKYGVFDVKIPQALEEVHAAYNSQLEAHQNDPEKFAKPEPLVYHYEYTIPDDVADVPNIKAKFDLTNPDRDNPALYTKKSAEKEPCFHYTLQRTYEVASQQELGDDRYQHVAVSLVDPANDRNPSGRLTQKGAYYYPIIQSMRLQPQRKLDFGQTAVRDAIEHTDIINLKVQDPQDDEIGARMGAREEVDLKYAREIQAAAEDIEAQDLSMAENGSDGDGGARERSPGQRNGRVDEDVDMDEA